MITTHGRRETRAHITHGRGLILALIIIGLFAGFLKLCRGADAQPLPTLQELVR